MIICDIVSYIIFIANNINLFQFIPTLTWIALDIILSYYKKKTNLYIYINSHRPLNYYFYYNY